MQTYYQACRLVVALFTIETSHYIIIRICITHIVFTHNIDYITFIVLYVHYWWHYTHCILQSSLFTSLFFGCQFVLPVALFREVSVRFFSSHQTPAPDPPVPSSHHVSPPSQGTLGVEPWCVSLSRLWARAQTVSPQGSGGPGACSTQNIDYLQVAVCGLRDVMFTVNYFQTFIYHT